VNAGGGYTLRGTLPFTINGSQTANSYAFGAGTCITSITDPTGRPDGFATPALTISTANPAARCDAGAVMLSATVGGGTTTAMTYTWTIGGTPYTNYANSYTIASLPASATYTVKVKNANACEITSSSGNITVNYSGTNGQPAHPDCGCASGTTQCTDGLCKTTTSYTVNGYCTACRQRNVEEYDQCGLKSTSNISDPSCTRGCGNCRKICDDAGHNGGTNITFVNSNCGRGFASLQYVVTADDTKCCCTRKR
jgi:hypothetical protein